MFETLFSRRGLTLDRLRALVELEQAGSFANAAPDDLVRQSQLSRQLKELSEFFGCELSERHGKTLRLTTRGVQLALAARDYLRTLEDFEFECRGEHAVFSIAAGDSLVQWLIIPRAGAALHKWSSARFATLSIRTNEIIRQLSDCRIDFGLVRRNAVVSGLKSSALGRITYVAVVPRKLVSGRNAPTLHQVFDSLPIAMQTTDGQFTKQVRDIAAGMQISMRPTLACQSFPQALAAVRSGMFASVVPQIALAELDIADFHVVHDPKLKALEREIVLAWNPRFTRVRQGAAHALEALQQALKL